MLPPDPPSSLQLLLIQWWWWCVWMFLLVALHPLGSPASTLAPAELSWIATQCVLLQTVPLLIAAFWHLKFPVAAIKYSSCLFALLPMCFAIDVLVFRGSGIHLLSEDFVELAREHLPRLIGFLSWGILFPLIAIAAYTAVGIGLSKLLLELVARNHPALRLIAYVAVLSLIVIAGGSAVWLSQAKRELTREKLHVDATRHPLSLLDPRDNSYLLIDSDHETDQPGSRSNKPFSFDRARFAEDVSDRMRQMRMNVVVEPAEDVKSASRPDVLFIICESLRSEMLAPDIMPHTFTAARSGWLLRQHYSGGNATSLGMFSLVSGLESMWFYKSEVRFAPALNRLFRQAGYELGFFAGHDDWQAFQMDAFLSPRQFDRYEIEPMDWLASDRRSIAKTMQYLRKPAPPATRPPRVAVLFLYSTHAPFAVADDHAHDLPAAPAHYPIPFPASWRGSVWNRYRNAARTLDAELADVLRSDAIVVLVGDHGESFMDDGTIGHGTKLSRAQTRTAAMIIGPHLAPREFSEPTTHMDILPTLLAAAGVQVSLADQFDGVDLATATPVELRSRVYSISNLVGRDLLLVPPSDHHSGAKFGTRVEFSLLDHTVIPRGALDVRGDLIGPPDNDLLRAWMHRLVR